MRLKLKIDNREHAILDKMEIPYTVETLDVGDIHICDKEDNILLLIERKTIPDLASSITDGRYKEQSQRLQHHSCPNHNIMYIIEGRMMDYNERFSRVSRKALYSAMIVLQYFKGFSLVRTFSKDETCLFVQQIITKMDKEKKTGYYHQYENKVFEEPAILPSLSMHKKENITESNVDICILSQIPGIKQTTAKSILDIYPSIRSLFDAYKEDPTFLDNITKPRRLSSKVKDNLKRFLLER
jgi:crossover junction endonuclease MUS81